MHFVSEFFAKQMFYCVNKLFYRLESIIKQRRLDKAEQEKKEALEREKNRRRTGQEITQARQK